MSMPEATAVRERPIIFSAEMVRAILDGRKSMTRRIVTPHPPSGFVQPETNGNGLWAWLRVRAKNQWHDVQCPFGVPGDRLWVKETWTPISEDTTGYLAGSFRPANTKCTGTSDGIVWRPGRYMPRRRSRVKLEITDVRVERLQDISEADANAEGATPRGESISFSTGERVVTDQRGFCDGFRSLWQEINGKRAPWESNPWVWVISFKLIDQEVSHAH